MTDRVTRVSLVASVNSYIADMHRAAQSTKKTGDEAADAAAKFEKQNQAMRQAGVGLVAMGAVATAATALAVKAAIDWETAWAGVTKTVDGTAQQLAVLEEDLRGLATTLPATHEEIAAVAEAAGQLGVQRENIASFTRVMVDLGETTNLSADEAATSIAQLMNIMQTAPDQVDNLGAALVALGNDGASTERDIIQMAQRIAGAGRIVGLTEGEVLGFANALASVGIEAEAGGSAISRIMTDIAKSVSTGGDQLERFATVAGMSSSEFQKAFGEDSADAIATFVEGLARIHAEGGDVFSTLSELGQSDIRVSQALLGLANSGDLLRKSLSLGNKALEENTALADEAAKRYETTAAKLQVVGNQINDAAIEFGDVFLPAVTAVAEAIGHLSNAFGDMPQPIQGFIASGVALTGALTLAGGAFLLAIPKMAEFRLALGSLAQSSIPAVASAAAGMQTAAVRSGTALAATARFLTGPWGIALAAAAVGVAALTQALDRLQASSEEMRNTAVTANDAADLLKTAFKGAPDGFNWFDNGATALREFQDRLDTVAVMQENWFEGILPANEAKVGDFNVALNKIGETLAGVAAEDLPAAQRAFQLLADRTDGSDRQLLALLRSMPQLQDALRRHATDAGDSATEQDLLNLAMQEATPPAESAAQAYHDAAEEAAGFADEILALVSAFDEANGYARDAERANAKWLESLAGIAEQVQRQRDEYEKTNGTLDGFAISLDRNTVAGSANRAMLSDVAQAARDSADAQLAQDQATLGADAAAQKWNSTLAAQRQAFIDSAISAGFNKDEVHKLADEIFKMPTEKEVQVLVETARANSAIARFVADQSARQIRIGVTTYSKGVDGLEVRVGNTLARAGGGILPGPPSSTDNMLIHAASGEFVVNAAATQRNRGLLEYINSGGQIRGYATGGEIQPGYASNVRPVAVTVTAPAGAPGAGPSLTVVNPVVRDLQAEAWDAVQTLGGLSDV